MTIFHGNPHDTNRIPQEQACYALLDSLRIPYDRIDHDPAFTMEACAEIDTVFGTRMCKNLFLRNSNGSAFYLLLMPGDKPFKTKDLSAQINSSRLSFGSHERMEELLDITPGSLSVLGLMNDKDKAVNLLIDKDVTAAEMIGCHPCINTSTLRFTVADLIDKIIPAMGHAPTYVDLPKGE